MCGIIGINENNEKLVRESGECFKYRGPDASDVFSDAQVTLGHHRLAIVDLDPRSTQPMSDNTGTVWIVFYGEIFNFKDVRAKLEKKYPFRTASDTEVLIYAYKEWGKDMTLHIEGMFALALYDSAKKKILLLRDHEGIKPLYYFSRDGVFAFASEIKGVMALLKRKGIRPSFDRQGLDIYLTLGYTSGAQTLYEGVRKLEKGCYMEYDLATNTETSGAYPIQFKKTATPEEYSALIEKKVLSHLIADVPVGVFFSGGTDSTLIAAILHKHGVDLETFSIKIDYKTEDAKYFKLISDRLKLKSHVFNFDIPELESVYEDVMSRMDEPSYDNSIFPTYFVSKKAAEKVKVVLSGEGGDEMFYGYPRSLEIAKMGDVIDYDATLVDRLYFALPSFKAKNHLFQKVYRVLKQPISYYLLSMSPARDHNTLVRWMAIKQICRKRGLKGLDLDREFYLDGDLLRKTDFATSYASIEGRVPLLDIDIVRGSGIVEGEKLQGGVLKAFLKKMLATYIPREFVYRSKSGFGVDIRTVFERSNLLKTDLERALPFLRERGVVSEQLSFADLVRRYPHYAFSLVTLYRSIVNNENA